MNSSYTCNEGRNCKDKKNCKKSHHCDPRKCKGCTCKYIHPCKWEKNCNSAKCTYSHPCKYGLKCRNFWEKKPCIGLHTESITLQNFGDILNSKVHTDYGKKKYQELASCFECDCKHINIDECLRQNKEYILFGK